MAKFELTLPREILEDIQKLNNDSEKIFKGMTRAGAEVALEAVKANMPESLQKSNFAECVFLSKDYITPSDGGVNTKVIVSGYFYNHNDVLTPAPLVANVFEYGSSTHTKCPFFRKSFKKRPIEAAMYAEQKKLSGGLLDE